MQRKLLLRLRKKLDIATKKLAKSYSVDKSGVDENGNKIGENGSYNSATNTISIDVDAGINNISESGLNGAMLRTLSHELTHFIQNWSPTQYEELKKFVIETLESENNQTADEMASKIANEQNLSYEKAIDEVVARACEMMLQDSKAVENLVKQNRTLAQKILDFIKSFYNKVSNAFKGVEARTQEANLIEKLNKFDEVLSIWDKALQTAAENSKSAIVEEELETDENGGLLFEVRENVVDNNGNTYRNVVVINKDIFKGKNKIKTFKEFIYNNLLGEQIAVFDDEGNSKVIEFAKSNERVKKDNANNSRKVINKLAYKKDRNSQLAVANSVELVEISLFDSKNETHNHQWLDEHGWEHRKSYMMFDGKIFEVTLNIAKTKDGRNILYDINKIRQVGATPFSAKQSGHNSFLTDKQIVTQQGENVNTQLEDRDNAYMQAVEKGDTATAQKLVDEVAMDWGAYSEDGKTPLKLYHGTQSFGFTEFDLDKMDDKQSIFLTSSIETASTYSGVEGERNANSKIVDVNKLSNEELAKYLNENTSVDEDEIEYYYYSKEEVTKKVDKAKKLMNKVALETKTILENENQLSETEKEYLHRVFEGVQNDNISEILIGLWYISNRSKAGNLFTLDVDEAEKQIRLANDIQEKTGGEPENVFVESDVDGYHYHIMEVYEAQQRAKLMATSGNYSLYAKLENPLVVDVEGRLWNDVRFEFKREPSEFSVYKAEDGYWYIFDYNESLRGVQGSKEKAEKAVKYLSTLTETWNTTRDVAEYAKYKGYDGVVFKNIEDNGGRGDYNANAFSDFVVVAFKANAVKSADPITYDDNGNVIPLSERFREDNADIRFDSREDIATQIQDVLDNKFDKKNHVYMGNTPQTLVNILGLHKLPMLLTNNHAYAMTVSEEQAKEDGRYKKKFHYHNLGIDRVKQLHSKLNNPVMIIKSNTDQNNLDIVVVTDMLDDDKSPILVALKPYGKGKYYSVKMRTNLIKSAYGKDTFNNYVDTAFKEKRILYVNKKIVNRQNAVRGSNSLTAYSSIDYNNSLSQYKQIVNSYYMQISKEDTQFENRDNIKEPKYVFANRLLRQFSSNADSGTVAQMLDDIYKAMDDGKNADKQIKEVAKLIYDSTYTFDKSADEQRKGFADEVRGYGIKITDLMRDEFGDDWADFVKKYGRIFNLTKNGKGSVDVAYDNLVEQFGVESGAVGAKDQLQAIADYYEQLKTNVISNDVSEELDAYGLDESEIDEYKSASISDIENYIKNQYDNYMKALDKAGYFDNTNRNLLANALMGATKNKDEQNKLRSYREVTRIANETEKQLKAIQKELNPLYFAEGKKDTEKIKRLEKKRNALQAKLSKIDSRLLQLEATQPLKDLVKRERDKAMKKQAEKGKQAVEKVRERRQASVYKDSIRKLKDKMQQRILRPTENSYVPSYLVKAMVDVCNALDFDTYEFNKDGSINKAQAKRNEVKAKLSLLKNEFTS